MSNSEEQEQYECDRCGAEVTEIDTVCPRCGNDVSEISKETAEQDNNQAHTPVIYENAGPVIFFSVLLILAVIFVLSVTLSSEKTDTETNSSNINSTINTAVSLIEKGKYSDATVELVSEKNSNETAHTLYNYACAKNEEAKSNFDMAQYYLDEVKPDYNGPLAKEILLAQKQIEKEKQSKSQAEAKKRTDMLTQLRKEYDQVEEVSWYYDKSTPRHIDNNNLLVYIGEKKDLGIWLRLKIRFAANDWLFIDKYTIKVDDKIYEIDPDYNEIKRDNGYGGVWEWYDIMVNEKELEIIKAIISSNKTILRYEGENRINDRTISKQEKAALRNVLNIYKAIGGSLK